MLTVIFHFNSKRENLDFTCDGVLLENRKEKNYRKEWKHYGDVNNNVTMIYDVKTFMTKCVNSITTEF